MVTNALLHAGTDIDLRRDGWTSAGVRVEVGDGSPHLPSRRRYAATAGTGRGLLMLESMVDDWGVTRHRAGQDRVVPHLRPAERPRRRRPRCADRPARTLRRRRDNVPVELRNMPLLLHAAWQEHAEALLREYLLASLDSGGEDPIQVHAEATDAIAVLEEHVPRTAGWRCRPTTLMDDAVEPHVSAPVIRGAGAGRARCAHFATLDRAIEAALDLSREGLVLTPPTQPEVQAFRRWLCRQVLRQAAGGAAGAVGDARRRRSTRRADRRWDPRTVTEASTGLIAADATSRILAVEPGGGPDPRVRRPRRARRAADRLDRPGALPAGPRRRLHDVPARRAASRCWTARSWCPALRRDGSEVEVELTVRDPGVGGGPLGAARRHPARRPADPRSPVVGSRWLSSEPGAGPSGRWTCARLSLVLRGRPRPRSC